MSQNYKPASWETVGELLHSWHSEQNRKAGRAAIEFLESEFRKKIPLYVHRNWPEDLVEDALQLILKKIVEQPIPPDIKSHSAYFHTAFSNRCIDLYRARRRQNRALVEAQDLDWDATSNPTHTIEDSYAHEELGEKARRAMELLNIEDRIVLKLMYQPHWLNDEELRWLGDKTELNLIGVQDAIVASKKTYALTQIFDPTEDDPTDKASRRKRLERFRKRKTRALEKLRVILQGGLS